MRCVVCALEQMINHYYDLVTDFYEYGWGTSFHFANRGARESFDASIARHEHFLAFRMRLDKGMKVLDVGCTSSTCSPLSLSPALWRAVTHAHTCRRRWWPGPRDCSLRRGPRDWYQQQPVPSHARQRAHAPSRHGEHVLVRQGRLYAQYASSLAGWRLTRAFSRLTSCACATVPFEDNTFDAVYQIEATAHAPDKVKCYAEILRVLKPGGVFGSYEWCLTKDYDASNARHRAIKKGIEEGDGLPDIASCEQVLEAIRAAGFEVLEERDLKDNALRTDLTWYEPLVPRYSLGPNFKHTKFGRFVLNKVLKGTSHLIVVRRCVVLTLLLARSRSHGVRAPRAQGNRRCADLPADRCRLVGRLGSARHLHAHVLYGCQEARVSQRATVRSHAEPLLPPPVHPLSPLLPLPLFLMSHDEVLVAVVLVIGSRVRVRVSLSLFSYIPLVLYSKVPLAHCVFSPASVWYAPFTLSSVSRCLAARCISSLLLSFPILTHRSPPHHSHTHGTQG